MCQQKAIQVGGGTRSWRQVLLRSLVERQRCGDRVGVVADDSVENTLAGDVDVSEDRRDVVLGGGGFDTDAFEASVLEV